MCGCEVFRKLGVFLVMVCGIGVVRMGLIMVVLLRLMMLLFCCVFVIGGSVVLRGLWVWVGGMLCIIGLGVCELVVGVVLFFDVGCRKVVKGWCGGFGLDMFRVWVWI